MAGIRQFAKKLRPYVLRGWETNHDIKNTVFLAGNGRSGTTWLSEIINRARRFRFINEPFNCRKTQEWSRFSYQQYFRRTQDEPDALRAASRILSGRVHNAWIDRQNEAFLASRRLVKDIRTNLMLGWIRQNFPQMKMVFIVREPLGVIASRQKLGWGPPLGIDRLRAMENLVEDHLREHWGFIESASGDEIRMQIIDWCIEHLVPLRQLHPAEFFMVSYEGLVSSPSDELGRLFEYLGIPLTDRILADLARPSASASKARRFGQKPTGLGANPENRRLVQETCARFGLAELLESAGYGAVDEIFR